MSLSAYIYRYLSLYLRLFVCYKLTCAHTYTKLYFRVFHGGKGATSRSPQGVEGIAYLTIYWGTAMRGKFSPKIPTGTHPIACPWGSDTGCFASSQSDLCSTLCSDFAVCNIIVYWTASFRHPYVSDKKRSSDCVPGLAANNGWAVSGRYIEPRRSYPVTAAQASRRREQPRDTW